jgi:hypothetical protein
MKGGAAGQCGAALFGSCHRNQSKGFDMTEDTISNKPVNSQPQLAENCAPTPPNSTPKSWRDVLPIHPAANLFPLMSSIELREMGEDIKENGLTSSIVLWSESVNSPIYLLDGRNRLDAIEAAGIADLVYRRKLNLKALHGLVDFSLVRGGVTHAVGIDPYAYVISANLTRRHVTAEKKRELIAKLLKMQPEKSDRQIAETVKADHKTVAKVRAEKEATGEIPQLTKTVGKDGKSRKTTKARGKPPTAPVTQPDKSKPKAIARNDIGPTSLGEVERLTARIQELENQNRVQQSKIIGLESENGELKTEIAELKAKIAELTATSIAPSVDGGLDIPSDLPRAVS